MITVQLQLKENTVADALAAASLNGLSFDAYVEWRLNLADHPASIPLETEGADPDLIHVVRVLMAEALREPSDEDGPEYLVEELYRRTDLADWNTRDRGSRIRIGKAFKRLVDAQQAGGQEMGDGRQMKVIFVGKTAQNQARYRTVRAG